MELITKTLALATELNQNIGFKTIKSLRVSIYALESNRKK